MINFGKDVFWISQNVGNHFKRQPSYSVTMSQSDRNASHFLYYYKALALEELTMLLLLDKTHNYLCISSVFLGLTVPLWLHSCFCFIVSACASDGFVSDSKFLSTIAVYCSFRPTLNLQSNQLIVD